MSFFKKQFKKHDTTLFLLLLLILLGGSIFGYYYYFRSEEEEGNAFPWWLISQRGFNPAIDGAFTNADGWRYAEWQFTEYLITDSESLDAYNYFYVQLTEDYLYVCSDLVSDITNEIGSSEGGGTPWFPSGEEWFSVWIDSDNNLDGFLGGEDWNTSSADGGEEMFLYVPNNDTFLDYFYDAWNMQTYGATLDGEAVDLAYGFQTTNFGQQAHRVYEVKIDRDALEGIGTNFSVAFLGYGTMFTLPDSYYWGAPTYHVSEIYYNGWVFEGAYFHCGTDCYDLDTIPTNAS